MAYSKWQVFANHPGSVTFPQTPDEAGHQGALTTTPVSVRYQQPHRRVPSEPRVKFRCSVKSEGTPGVESKELPEGSLSSQLRVGGAGGLPRGHAAPPWLTEEVQVPVPLGSVIQDWPLSAGRQEELVMY